MGQAGVGLGGGLTLSLPQGSLLKVVLEDYLRLKKLFAQRMVQKASSCHSSISEVAGWAGELCAVPQPWGCSLPLLLFCPPRPSQSLWNSAARAKDSNGWGSRKSEGRLCFLGSLEGFPEMGC